MHEQLIIRYYSPNRIWPDNFMEHVFHSVYIHDTRIEFRNINAWSVQHKIITFLLYYWYGISMYQRDGICCMFFLFSPNDSSLHCTYLIHSFDVSSWPLSFCCRYTKSLCNRISSNGYSSSRKSVCIIEYIPKKEDKCMLEVI